MSDLNAIARIAKRPALVDTAIVGGLLAIGILAAAVPITERGSAAVTTSDLLSVATVIVIILPLAWRRRYPTAVMALSGALYFVRLALGYPQIGALNLTQLAAVYSVSTYEQRPFADRVRALAGIAVTAAFLATAAAGRIDVATAVVSVATWAAAAFFGEAVWVRGRYQDALEDRARRAEAEQAERDRRAVQDERARIAREFHDIWAHTLSVVVLQAEAAEEVFDTSPDQARQALSRIRRAGRQALTEVRRLIATDMAATGAERLDTMPTLRDLESLADELRASGMPVTVSISGRVDRLPSDMNLSAYRIVQQALTNALTHGGTGSTASVHVVASADEVRIDVIDDGAGTHDRSRLGGSGRGLVGMRERAALFGGEVVAGPEAGGGFGVHARIPLAVEP